MSELEDILNYLETTSLEPHDDYERLYGNI